MSKKKLWINVTNLMADQAIIEELMPYHNGAEIMEDMANALIKEGYKVHVMTEGIDDWPIIKDTAENAAESLRLADDLNPSQLVGPPDPYTTGEIMLAFFNQSIQYTLAKRVKEIPHPDDVDIVLWGNGWFTPVLICGNQLATSHLLTWRNAIDSDNNMYGLVMKDSAYILKKKALLRAAVIDVMARISFMTDITGIIHRGYYPELSYSERNINWAFTNVVISPFTEMTDQTIFRLFKKTDRAIYHENLAETLTFMSEDFLDYAHSVNSAVHNRFKLYNGNNPANMVAKLMTFYEAFPYHYNYDFCETDIPCTKTQMADARENFIECWHDKTIDIARAIVGEPN